MRDERWTAVIQFLALKLDQWRAQEITGSSAFEELRALHKRDGKVEGMNEFMEQLEAQAFAE